MDYRIEKDTMGEVRVPHDKLWGPQTERSRMNFRIGKEKMPLELIYAYAILKKAAAKINCELGTLSEIKQQAIVTVCEEISDGLLDSHFPLAVWQTGSGTQSNMNVNEVIGNKGNQWLEEKGSSERLHPNDDVNKSQSSNDSFPTAMHIAAYQAVQMKLMPVLTQLRDSLKEKEEQYGDLIKIGRTHLQDATPLTLGQEISGWRAMLDKNMKMIQESSQYLLELAIGGTAVGTGINAHRDFGKKVVDYIRAETGYDFQTSSNTFQALTSHDEIVHVHGALKALAADLMKIANDVRWLASGPRSGIGELMIPANEPGSSIMPGKVNPTQSEALTMVTAQVFGNDTTISFAASQGNFELNVFKPVIIYNFLQTIELLTDGIHSFDEHCIKGLQANEIKIQENMQRSLMLVTALNPYIGYEKAAEIAKKAHRDNTTLKEAALSLGYVTEEQFDSWLDPAKMVYSDK
ncbi:class II fumarate hydratase [Peribacillus saganii]|uniref:Fumarate hydratase class II n=1 Tax=Peribacillus saganii TaxID=2303992 RepID=A0A372LE14_9BACI|nr:class II fumarate hydratase [Peribacillus saganii]RFU64447.1 class II fumarate hydratase [Peribacillus saganii]